MKTLEQRKALSRAAEFIFGKVDLASIPYDHSRIKRLPAGKAEGIYKPKGSGYDSGLVLQPVNVTRGVSAVARGCYR